MTHLPIKPTWSLLVLLTAFLAWGTSAQAADNPFSIGPLLGLSFANNGGGTNIMYGAEADYRLVPELSYGLYFAHTPMGTTTPPGGSEYSRSLTDLAAEGSYHFLGMLDGWRLGAKLGLGWANSTVNGNGGTTTTGLVLGPHLGYDYPLGINVSFGGEINYLYATQSDGANAVNIFGVLKFIF